MKWEGRGNGQSSVATFVVSLQDRPSLIYVSSTKRGNNIKALAGSYQLWDVSLRSSRTIHQQEQHQSNCCYPYQSNKPICYTISLETDWVLSCSWYPCCWFFLVFLNHSLRSVHPLLFFWQVVSWLVWFWFGVLDVLVNNGNHFQFIQCLTLVDNCI